MKRGEALLKAAKMVTEERNEEYGEPVPQLENVQRIKQAVGHNASAHLSDAEKECIDSICVKLSRLAFGKPSEDSWLDIIGYAAIGAEAWSATVPAPLAVRSPLRETLDESLRSLKGE